MRSSLYQDTRKMLANLELDDDVNGSCFHLQNTQALLLVGIYEFTQNLFRRAWTTVGRALRLAQLQRLDQLDPLFDDCIFSPEKQVEGRKLVEEKRRTFWTAYCIDRLFSGIDDLPPTVAENVVGIWLSSIVLDIKAKLVD
jgi:hypothetical protein